jgi:uncharacterized protein YlxP (DUF503 family)
VSDAFFAVLRIELHFPDVASLKGKRAELKAVTAGLRQRFGADLAEVAHQDTWQRSTLVACVCAGSEGRVCERTDAIGRWLDARLPQGVTISRRLASWTDLESLG